MKKLFIAITLMMLFGSRSISLIRLTMRRALARSCFIHHAKSSNAAMSNSKFLKCFLKADACGAFFGFQKPPFHRFAFRQISRFLFRFNFVPNLYRHNYADRISIRI